MIEQAKKNIEQLVKAMSKEERIEALKSFGSEEIVLELNRRLYVLERDMDAVRAALEVQ